MHQQENPQASRSGAALSHALLISRTSAPCAPTEQEVAEIAQERLQSGEDFVGTPEQLLEQMQPFVDLGVDYFMLDCSGFPNLTTVKMLANEVLPALNGRMMNNRSPAI